MQAELTEPSSAPQDIRDVQTLKHEGLFQLCDRYGDIHEDPEAALGLYFRDTRFLSRWELLVDGRRPLHLHAEADRNFSMLVETTYACERPLPDGRRRTENVQISRHRWLESGFREAIKIQNFGAHRAMRVELRFGADFLDLFEVRGMIREKRGTLLEPDVASDRVTLSYDGRDGVRRDLSILFDPPPDELDAGRAVWTVQASTKAVVRLDIRVEPRAGDQTPAALTHEELESEYTQWRKRCTRFRVSNDLMQRYLDRAVLDLRMMQTTSEDGVPAMDAGVPWFSTLFGRDSLLAAYQALGVNTDLARGTLRRLAELQGTTDDPWRDEEPGKILHEIRIGELATLGEIPHTPYYGSIDATPLWLVLYGYVWKWTGDLDFVEQLWPNAERALGWIDHHGDRDGDGYVEYAKRSDGGLDNQGWKDSFDGILGEDGTIPEGPLALCEVQGYVYDGKRRTAGVARALGKHDVARELEAQAEAMKQRFNRDFWMNEYGTYAVALDGNKQQVRSLTSNAGHCLWSGIVDAPKAARVARRLLAPDMLSGWGVRTLSKRNPSYDPIGYHTGTVWPHDNSLIAHGMRLYGLTDEAHRVIDELAIAGSYFRAARYPELFCGYGKEEVPVPVEYPVACRPQAWATGAPLLMLRSYGGMSADAPTKTLSIVRPSLPLWLERAEIVGMRVGDARVDLLFVQRDGTTGVQVLRKDGELDIIVRY